MKSVWLAALVLLGAGLPLFAQALDSTALQQRLAVLAEGSPEDRAAALRSLETLGSTPADRLVVH